MKTPPPPPRPPPVAPAPPRPLSTLPPAPPPAPRRCARSAGAARCPSLGASYHIGIDGISLLLVLLTTFLMPIALASAWHAIEDRTKEFVIAMLVLETGMVGVFVSLDLFLFFVFWEAMLIPMYFVIGVWGGPNRIYAAVKFVLYTLVGSALMLLAILALYSPHAVATGTFTFDLPTLARWVVP